MHLKSIRLVLTIKVTRKQKILRLNRPFRAAKKYTNEQVQKHRLHQQKACSQQQNALCQANIQANRQANEARQVAHGESSLDERLAQEQLYTHVQDGAIQLENITDEGFRLATGAHESTQLDQSKSVNRDKGRIQHRDHALPPQLQYRLILWESQRIGHCHPNDNTHRLLQQFKENRADRRPCLQPIILLLDQLASRPLLRLSHGATIVLLHLLYPTTADTECSS